MDGGAEAFRERGRNRAMRTLMEVMELVEDLVVGGWVDVTVVDDADAGLCSANLKGVVVDFFSEERAGAGGSTTGDAER